MSDLLAKLAAPFPPARVSWRVGSTTQAKDKGMALAYLDSRDVQDRLDQVCGAEWQCKYPHAGQKTVCEIGIKVGGEWIWKADGAGDSDVEAEKGALSDAFKRAAVKWGIGRYLYDMDSPWVSIVQKGKSYVIADNELARLHKLLPSGGAAPAPEIDRVRNAPGISEAKTWVRDHIRELNAVTSVSDFMEIIEGARTRWVKIAGVYPNLWNGVDGSGLRGEAQKVATIIQARASFDPFVKEVEIAAREIQPQAQAAE